MRIFHLSTFLIVSCTLFGQLEISDKPVAPKTFVAFVSPVSTASDMMHLQDEIRNSGFDFNLEEIKFTDDGRLQSFNAEFSNPCKGSPYAFKGATDFSDPKHHPIGVIVASEDCSTGVFTTTYQNMNMMFNIFFKEFNPEYIFYAWEGDLDMVKDVVWEGR